MKTLSLVKRMTAAFIFLIAFSCNIDSVQDNEPLPESKIENTDTATSARKGKYECKEIKKKIYVIYDTSNPDWNIDPNDVKDKFEREMSRNFTIYQIIRNDTKPCLHEDVWYVDCKEYSDYQRGNGNDDDSTDDDAILLDPNDYDGDCY